MHSRMIVSKRAWMGAKMPRSVGKTVMSRRKRVRMPAMKAASSEVRARKTAVCGAQKPSGPTQRRRQKRVRMRKFSCAFAIVWRTEEMKRNVGLSVNPLKKGQKVRESEGEKFL